MTGSVVLGGTFATAMPFVQTAEQLYVLRFLLGCAESGFAPGIVYYCSTWMPARYRANTIAITMLAIPISVIIGGPLCGWLMRADNPLHLPGWRWMRSEEHTSELQSRENLVCRLLLEKKKYTMTWII